MATRGRVVDLKDGYWYKVDTNPIIHECCECGVRHEVDFKTWKQDLYWRWRCLDDEEASTERDTGKPRKEEVKEAKRLLPKGKKKDGKHPGKHARGSK